MGPVDFINPSTFDSPTTYNHIPRNNDKDEEAKVDDSNSDLGSFSAEAFGANEDGTVRASSPVNPAALQPAAALLPRLRRALSNSKTRFMALRRSLLQCCRSPKPTSTHRRSLLLHCPSLRRLVRHRRPWPLTPLRPWPPEWSPSECEEEAGGGVWWLL